jgi:DNA repair exonuclease SbcCD ATPase subunit
MTPEKLDALEALPSAPGCEMCEHVEEIISALREAETIIATLRAEVERLKGEVSYFAKTEEEYGRITQSLADAGLPVTTPSAQGRPLMEVDEAVRALIERTQKAEIATLLARTEKAEAEADVRSGKWCEKNRAEGRGGCGMCAWCWRLERDRAEKAEADLARVTAEAAAMREALGLAEESVEEAGGREMRHELWCPRCGRTTEVDTCGCCCRCKFPLIDPKVVRQIRAADRKKLREAMRVLRGVEVNGCGDLEPGYCPWCTASVDPGGHAPGCELAVLIGAKRRTM